MFNMQQKACFIGNPVDNPLYSLVYNAAFTAVGLHVQYVDIEVIPKKLSKFMDRVRQGEFLGISVGSPFKYDVLNYVNHTTDEARQMGEINTLYYDNKVLIGDNTDWFGVKAALHDYDLKNKKVLVYGGGSAARSALFALQDLGVELVFVTNRTEAKAQLLVNEYGSVLCDSLNLPQVDILINATSVGQMDSNFLLMEEDYLGKCELVVDMVPNDTMLIKSAKSLGVEVIPGKAILLYQLTRQFELFTGLSAPIEEMAKVLGFKI